MKIEHHRPTPISGIRKKTIPYPMGYGIVFLYIEKGKEPPVWAALGNGTD